MSKLATYIVAGAVSLTLAGSLSAPVYATDDSTGRHTSSQNRGRDHAEDDGTTDHEDDRNEDKSGNKDEAEHQNGDDKNTDDREHEDDKNEDKSGRDHAEDNDKKPVAATTGDKDQTPTLPAAGINAVTPVVALLAAVAGYVGYLLHLKRREA